MIVVAEIYAIHLVIFEQRPKKEAGVQDVQQRLNFCLFLQEWTHHRSVAVVIGS